MPAGDRRVKKLTLKTILPSAEPVETLIKKNIYIIILFNLK